MLLQRASRQQTKIKLSLAGASGSGKTYSALLIAYGICKDWSKIAVIDTENFSASLYANLGDFNVINIQEPYNPEKYVKAIGLCYSEGMEVIIVDSITHEWTGKGGCLDLHEKETARMKIPNSFTAWASITPRHQDFIDAIIQCPLHVICTIRSKSEYILTERNGKSVPQKVGMSPITRDGFEFEVSVALELDQNHQAFCSKDRTGLFADKNPFVITPETGERLINWSQSLGGSTVDEVSKRIGECKSVQELLELYTQHPQFKVVLKPEFETRKRQILIGAEVDKQLLNLNQHQNGTAK